jgi:uncharacterized delta-60 repeat protein
MSFKRLGRTASLVILIALTITFAVQAAAGGLDCAFGDFGMVTATPAGITIFQGGKAMAMYTGGAQAGKLVMVGITDSYPARNGIVARFTADGGLDLTFNTTGFSAVFDSGGDDIFNTVTTQDDGKVVVAGKAKASGDPYSKILVVRYNSDGTLDTSFSSDGWQTDFIGSSDSEWYDVVTDPSGNIFVAGRSTTGASTSLNHLATIVKYNSSGVWQNTWTYDLGTSGNEDFQRIIPASSGGFYAAGFGFNGSYDSSAIVYINSDGSLNPAFDGDGVKRFSVAGVESEYVYGMALQSDNKIVITGMADTAAGASFTWSLYAARLNTDGSFDTTFSSDGKDVFTLGSASDKARDILVQSDGMIVVTGETNRSGTSNDFYVRRYQSDGTLDSTFGSGGMVYVDFAANYDVPYNIVQQSNGKLVVGGQAYTAGSTGMGMARLLYDDPNMSYGAVRLTQPDTTMVYSGTNDNQIMRVEVCINGSVSPLDLTGMTFNTTGSTNAVDITKARVWRTVDGNFATGNQYGSDANSPSGAFTVNGSYPLVAGVTNFWLTYDISPTATSNASHVVDAGLDSLTFSGATGTVAISPTTVTGSRTIINAYNTDAWISNVTLNTINNTSGADPGGWGDYTALTTTLTPGQSYNLSVSMQFSGYTGEYVTAFFDWNADGDFVDAGESFPLWANVSDGGSTPFTDSKTVSIAVPGGATIGNTRFMLALDYYNAPDGILNSSGYGENEMYGLTIAASTVTISGNAGIGGASLGYTDGTAKTATADGAGVYSFPVSSGWTGDVTPSLAGYTFSPDKTSYTDITSDQTTNYSVVTCTPQTTGTVNWSVAFNACPTGAKKIVPSGLTVVIDSDISLTGDLEVQTGGTLDPNGKTVTLTGNTAQTLTGTPPAMTFYNLVINKTNKTDTVTISGKLKVTKKLTITKGKLVSASDYGDIEILDEGTLELTSDITVGGNFVKSVDGTFIHNNHKVTFDGATTQNLTLGSSTAFYDLEVSAGTVLVETVSDDSAYVANMVSNHGTIRKSQNVTGTGLQVFGITEVEMDVTSYGGAGHDITVDWVGTDHPHKTTKVGVGSYFTITNTGGDTLTLTLPHTFGTAPSIKACRYVGGTTGWECGTDAANSYDETTVTRTGVSAFSDWAPGNNVGPTAVRLSGFSASSANGLPLGSMALLTVVLGGGAFAWRRRVK